MDGKKRQSMCHVNSQPQEVIEEGEEEEMSPPLPENREGPEGEEDIDGLPWHHAQLALLYGRQVADDIVHPKMERKQVNVDPKLRSKGHAGAAQLWSMLRNESNGKLLEEDQKIPSGLKESYGAFVRQLVLQKGEVPVKRNFPEKADVPDLDHLLDRRRLLQTLDIRHKIELMGRSSKINQDKANILMYNNPIPDLVNASGEDGIDRYLPTWVEDDAESVASYKKWIDDNTNDVSGMKPSDSLMELVRPITRDTSRHQGPPKVKFLTEAQAGAERGKFSDKYKAKKDSQHAVTNPEDIRADIAMDDPDIKPFRGDNVRSAKKNTRRTKQEPEWQPLTLNALVGYSDKKNTQGTGTFRNGSMKMYPTSTSRITSAVPSS